MSTIMSMTGYGSAQGSLPDESVLSVEIKSVNQRFLEINIRLPSGNESLDQAIQKLIKPRLSRGRVDLFINRKIPNSSGRARVASFDSTLFTSSLELLSDNLSAVYPDETERKKVISGLLLSRGDIFAITEDESDRSLPENIVIPVVSAALDQLITMRKLEGENLRLALVGHLTKVDEFVAQVGPLVGESVERFRTRVSEKLKQVELPLGEERLATEVAILADRTDVSEEMERLASHLAQFRDLLASGNEIGKRLDFLVQEMGREVNTTGSKSQSSKISGMVVETKAVLEKIREQVQNIE